jgi:hypothetical protein
MIYGEILFIKYCKKAGNPGDNLRIEKVLQGCWLGVA